MPPHESLIPQHGGYRDLKSFQVAQMVFDITVRFCSRYIDKRSRTCDQMVQAARSGVQNIAEGSQASGTSKKMEIKLTNVARASLEELRLDYEDFLRQRGLTLWAKDDLRREHLVARRCATADDVARWVKEMHDGQDGLDGQNGPDGPDGPDRPDGHDGSDGHNGQDSSVPSIQSISSIRPTYPEIAANAAHVLIGVASALLGRQIAAQAKAFEAEGGFTERLYRVRSKNRNRKP
jgi:four helix bundle suffix protein